jgi:hypothetical protein
MGEQFGAIDWWSENATCREAVGVHEKAEKLSAQDREFPSVEPTNNVCLLPPRGMKKIRSNLFVSRRNDALP